jgi:hypothetical protein
MRRIQIKLLKISRLMIGNFEQGFYYYVASSTVIDIDKGYMIYQLRGPAVTFCHFLSQNFLFNSAFENDLTD